MTLFVWIPESPTHPGLYANKSDFGAGKVTGLSMQPSTTSHWHALHFPTREECAAWCASHPHPVFVPVEHGFGDKE